MITVIDYGVGNIGSVIKAFNYLNISVKISSKKNDIKKAEALILPGVGAFATGMENLQRKGLTDLIIKEVREGKPLLGICLGLQLLFSESEESSGVKGLDLIKGKVKKFSGDLVDKIPHMGWNTLQQVEEIKLFSGIPEPHDFYFIHSYYVQPEKSEVIAAKTSYGQVKFASLVRKNNIWGIQPHPEKSSRKGLCFIKNFVNYAKDK